MTEQVYYQNLIGCLQSMKHSIPACLSAQERQQVCSRLSLMQSQARVILAALKQDEDRH